MEAREGSTPSCAGVKTASMVCVLECIQAQQKTMHSVRQQGPRGVLAYPYPGGSTVPGGGR
jgi:hypothetical protein